MIECAVLAVGIHIASAHRPAREFHNNFNPGVYVECDGWVAGAYRNTLSRPTVYAGHTWRYGLAGVTLGVATGYKKTLVAGCRTASGEPCFRGIASGPLYPVIAPHVQFGGARLVIVPGIGSSSSVVHLAYEWKLR